MKLRDWLLLCTLCAAPWLRADELVVTSASAPNVDGRLDPAEWSAATPIEGFVQVEPEVDGVPSAATRLYLLRDAEQLYLGLDLPQSDPVVAREWVQGADLGGDDRVTVLLDPFESGTRGYAFTVNANGARSEALIEDVDELDEDWEDLWFAAATRSATGWQVEIAIPFRSLSFPANVDRWHINVMRQLAARNETIALAHRQRRVDLGAALPVGGLTGASAATGWLLIATGVASVRREEFLTRRTTEFEPSLDAFYKLGPSLTAAFTLNTDFSSAEVDQRELNLTRFELFFPERRDFFLRDANVFEFGGLEENGLPFFSRRLGLGLEGEPLDIRAGARLTGQVDRWTIGAVAVHQDLEERSGRDTLGVARVRAEVDEHHTLGAIATRGEPVEGASDALYGIDYRYSHDEVLGDNEVELFAWWQSLDPEGAVRGSDAWGFSAEWPNETIEARLALADIDDDFAPPLGFVNRDGIRDWSGEFRYRFRPDWPGIRTVDTGLDVQIVDDSDGVLESRRQELSLFDIGLEAGDEIELLYIRQFEFLDDEFELTDEIEIEPGRYRFDRYGLGFASAPQRAATLALEYENGDFLGGRLCSIEGSIGWRPTDRLQLGLDYEHNRLRFADTRQTLKLARLFARYAFDGSWSLASLVQYDNESHEVGMNTRLRWTPSAGQEHFLVLNLGRARDEDTRRYHTETFESLLRVSFTFLF